MGRYPVIEPLRHDGRDYAPGDVVELTAEQSVHLQQIGAVGEAVAQAQPAQKKRAKE